MTWIIIKGPNWHGTSGVHTHMTNTRITDAEIFERRYPVILRTFSLRPGSGGIGVFNGGDGVIRDVEFRVPVQVSILSERRVFHPYGLLGGGQAACGLNWWIRHVDYPVTGGNANAANGGGGGVGVDDTGIKERDDGSTTTNPKTKTTRILKINLGAKNTALMNPGDHIIVCTPGGGAWGSPEQSADHHHHHHHHSDGGGSGGGGGGGGNYIKRHGNYDPRLAWRGGGSLLGRTQLQESSN